MKRLFTFALCLFTFVLFAQNKTLEPKLENIAWIAGNWKGEAFGGQTEENWSKPSGGSMMATFKLINDGKVTFYEIEIIREIENTLILQLKHFGNDLKGWETKDETVDFPLIEITENKVVFEGMTFEKISKNEMNVYVDIEDKGKTETIKFNYQKTADSGKKNKTSLPVQLANEDIVIDGKPNETIWNTAKWQPINQLWLGEAFAPDDFEGRYKLAWKQDALYLLAEITDDKLRDVFKNPLERWWDEDCLEIFVDEDNSGGNHQFNNNAFAYHLDLEGNVVDVDNTKQGILYNSHVKSARKTKGNTTFWEVKISLFNDSYSIENNNHPIQLSSGKKIGFALAYCDNDTSEHRENFIGSVFVEGADKDRGWIDANIFGTIELKN